MIDFYTDGATCGANHRLGSVSHVGLGVYSPDLKIETHRLDEGISNNEAEFKALILGLEIAVSNKVKKARFYMDSKIVCNRANGHRPRNPIYKNARMDRFQNRVLELADEFEEIHFIWIPRQKNWKADQLSKKGSKLYKKERVS